MSRPARERKATQRLEPEERKEVKSFSYSGGAGEALGDISWVRLSLDKLKSDDEALQLLHSLLFGSQGKASSRKKQLRLFSGFPSAEDPNTRTKTVNKLTASKKWTVSALKTCCGLLGVEKSGSRDDVIGRLVDFLLSPSELKSVPDKTKKTKKRKKATKTSKKRKSSDDGPKKLSPYILFSQANRDVVKKKNPEASFGDVAKLLGAAWKALSDDEKDVWVKAAAAANGGVAAASKSKKKKQKTEKEDAKEEKDDEESSDEEEDGSDSDGDDYGGAEEEEDRDKDLFPDSDEEA